MGRTPGGAPRIAPVGELGITGERIIVGLRACCAPERVRKGGRAEPDSTRGAPGACMLGTRPWPMPGRTGSALGAPAPPGPGTGRDTGITGIDMRFIADGCARGPCWRWGVVPMGGFQLLRPVAVSTNTFLPAAASLHHVRGIARYNTYHCRVQPGGSCGGRAGCDDIWRLEGQGWTVGGMSVVRKVTFCWQRGAPP